MWPPHRLTAALVLTALLHATTTAAQGPASPAQSASDVPALDLSALDVTEIAPGVYLHAGKLQDWLPATGGGGGNLAFVVGSRCVAVIDTGGTPQLGRRWRATIERSTRLPICYVIDTHAHPDHVLGNAAFVSP